MSFFNPPSPYCKSKRSKYLVKVSKKWLFTGESFSEALNLASVNQQYDKRLFLELKKNTSSEHLLSYCGLLDSSIRAFDTDLPRENSRFTCINPL